ncbi:hypothetical protein D9M71_786330 [compost metagenome]
MVPPATMLPEPDTWMLPPAPLIETASCSMTSLLPSKRVLMLRMASWFSPATTRCAAGARKNTTSTAPLTTILLTERIGRSSFS